MKTFNIFILGCQMNYADANRLRTVLNSCGLKETSESNADLVIVVACSVKQKPVQKIWGKIRNWTRDNKRTWITGCVLPEDKKKLEKRVDKIFKIDEMEKVCHSEFNSESQTNTKTRILERSSRRLAPQDDSPDVIHGAQFSEHICNF